MFVGNIVLTSVASSRDCGLYVYLHRQMLLKLFLANNTFTVHAKGYNSFSHRIPQHTSLEGVVLHVNTTTLNANMPKKKTAT